MAVQVNLPGVRKAAILVLTLGEEASAEVLKHLQEEEIERLAKELAGLGGVPAEAGEKVLDEFHTKASAADYMTRGGVDYTRRLLDKGDPADWPKPTVRRWLPHKRGRPVPPTAISARQTS